MRKPTEARIHHTRVQRPERLTGGLLVLGGVTFFAGGALHPGDSGTGSKVHQLHEMLVNSMWYPSHTLMLVAMMSFAAAVLAIRRRSGLGAQMATVTGVVSVIAFVGVIGMTLHLFAATEAAAIASGETTFWYHVHTWNETIVDPLWGLGIAALAVAGGRARILGNPLTLPIGLVGGLAFALASATIAFTDTLDPLFPVASLIGVWGVIVGVLALTSRTGT